MDATTARACFVTITCFPSDAVGVVVRLSSYLDCQGRALGENGFAALAGGSIAAGLLSGLVTIFVALIGYRLILGHTPDIRDGVAWMIRLGLTLALATSWPAFQTLIYRVAVDGPGELAQVLLPSTGLSTEGQTQRIQAAYDRLRLGTGPAALPALPRERSSSALVEQPAPLATTLPRSSSLGQPPLPQTAALLVISTEGVAGALRVAIGLLLAVGPLIVMGLLFDTTLGLVTGWLRALVGAALGLLAATVVIAIELVVVESEIARLLQSPGAILDDATFDPQSISTIVLLFSVVTLVATLSASRVAGSLRLSFAPLRTAALTERNSAPASSMASLRGGGVNETRAATLAERPGRAGAVAGALSNNVRREQAEGGEVSGLPSRHVSIPSSRSGGDTDRAIVPLGVVGRRSLPRRSRTATLRDGTR